MKGFTQMMKIKLTVWQYLPYHQGQWRTKPPASSQSRSRPGPKPRPRMRRNAKTKASSEECTSQMEQTKLEDRNELECTESSQRPRAHSQDHVEKICSELPPRSTMEGKATAVLPKSPSRPVPKPRMRCNAKTKANSEECASQMEQTKLEDRNELECTESAQRPRAPSQDHVEEI